MAALRSSYWSVVEDGIRQPSLLSTTPDLFARWRDSSSQTGYEADLIQITDEAVERCVD